MIRIFKSIVISLMCLSTAMAAEVELQPDHPDTYVVKKGDTLWDISETFLKTPWLWPEIWQVNPQVENPHLIYPGDVLSLVYIDGKPRIIRGTADGDKVTTIMPSGVIKVSPRAHVISTGDAIPTIPLDAISAFLVGARVVDEEQLEDAPYVLAGREQRLINAAGHEAYIRGVEKYPGATSYSVFRKGSAYVDPYTKELLGYEAKHLGIGDLLPGSEGQAVAKILLKESNQEILKGDRLLPADEKQYQANFYPHSPVADFAGEIISVYGGVSQIGTYDVVVINRGERESVEVGHVMRVMHRGEVIYDNIGQSSKNKDRNFLRKTIDTLSGNGNLSGEAVKLPDEEAGLLMVFRTFEKVSLGLVLKAKIPLRVGDRVLAPE